AKRSYHLGFGKTPPNRSILSKSNTLRDYRIFEEFAFYMVGQAQRRRITKEFELHGRFYAVDSTTIDLCLSVFRWAEFRTTKSGIRIHTQIDIATEIPVFYRITTAKIHDVNSHGLD
ncbi:MAG: IS4 family transposase, partial [Spirochaetales bacterium]|nr:IS4 family transposase [Candidatus Physcosoma equi]